MSDEKRAPLNKSPKIAEKWERFCRLRANGQNQGDAHMNCGYPKSHNRRTHENGGYKLETKPQIRARIEELRKHAATVTEEMALVSKVEVMEKLRENAEAATKAGQYQAVHASWKTYGGEIGMFTEKQEIHTFDHKIDAYEQEELLAYVKGMTSEIGLRVVDQTDEEKRAWIRTNAPALGFRLYEGRRDTEGPESKEGSPLPTLQ